MTIKSKMIKRRIKFAPSPSPDVTGYRMFFCPEAEELTEASKSIDIGNRTEFEIPGEFADLAGLDGIYKAAIVAYDDAGNMSASGLEAIVPLDFLPPEAPGALEVL